MIQIIHEHKVIPKLKIKVNDKEVDFQNNYQSIDIDIDEEFGFSYLTVQLLNDAEFKIKDIRVANQSVRQTLFMSYVDEGSNRYQPATELYKSGQVWTMPFIYPISTWISVIDQKFPPNTLGTDIFSNYKIFFPKRVELDEKFIPVVRDFFKYDFDFVAIKKSELSQFNDPFELFDVNINSTELYNEIYENLDLLRVVKGQTIYNMIDDLNFNKKDHWFTTNTHRHGNLVMDQNLLPKTFEFLNNFEHKIDSATISVTPPGGYAVTHIDKKSSDSDVRFLGCKQLYIPLNYPSGSMAKLHGVGLVPCQPVIFNPQYYSHSVVNNSKEYRIVLSIIFDYQCTDWKT
jgi:hypothetical protein